jgi:hypothetical protein
VLSSEFHYIYCNCKNVEKPHSLQSLRWKGTLENLSRVKCAIYNIWLVVAQLMFLSVAFLNLYLNKKFQEEIMMPVFLKVFHTTL